MGLLRSDKRHTDNLPISTPSSATIDMQILYYSGVKSNKT